MNETRYVSDELRVRVLVAMEELNPGCAIVDVAQPERPAG
jgi:hypothetical protein